MNVQEIIEVLEHIKEDTVLNSKRYEALESAILYARIYKQIKWEHDIAIHQIEELGGQFGENTELIKNRIYNEAIDDFMRETMNVKNMYVGLDYDRAIMVSDLNDIAEHLKGGKNE